MKVPIKFISFLFPLAVLPISSASLLAVYQEHAEFKPGNHLAYLDSATVATVTVGETVSEFSDLSSAINAWVDGSTLRLEKDVTGAMNLTSGTITLDLNNHCLSNSTRIIELNGANLTLIDSSTDKTRHYYNVNREGAATLSETPTDHFFDGGYLTGVADGGTNGIHVTSGKLTFSGGTVFGNRGGHGAGIKVSESGEMLFEKDAAVIGNYQANEYGSGGGVSNNGTVVMTGGVIRDNTAKYGVGGFRCEAGSFTITGGEVTGNYGHTWIPSGVQIDGNSEIHIGGSAKIYNNYYLNTQKDLGINEGQNFIDICEPLTEEAKIYIVPTNDQSGSYTQASNPMVMTKNWSKVMGDKDPYAFIRCNNIYTRSNPTLLGEYEVFLKEGEVAVGKVNYTISFDANSGSGTMANVDITKRSFTLPENGFVAPENHVFDGWKVDDNTTTYQPGEEIIVDKNTTIKAQWSALPLVSFSSNGGSGEMEDVTVSDGKIAIPENGFTAPEGMKFIGWKELKSGTFYSPGDIATFDEDATLAAQWSPIASEEWANLFGNVYAENGIAPTTRVLVQLFKGKELLGSTVTNNDGEYRLDCPNGIYSIVVEYDGFVDTTLVEVFGPTNKNIELSGANTQSLVNVIGDEAIAVGGLEKLAKTIRNTESIPSDSSLTLTMNVEQQEAEKAEHVDEFEEQAVRQNLKFYDIVVEKSVDGVSTYLDTTSDVLEIVIPYENIDRSEISVYSYHDGELITYVESSTKDADTFSLDLENGLVRIYANKFSSFAIAYTPYFSLNVNVSLGGYSGNVNAKLEKADTKEVVALLENITLDQVAFANLNKGDYLLTITWVDGANNSITVPISIQQSAA